MEIESPGYRLIFIDVDGVLNRVANGDTTHPFERVLMERFARLCRETGATVVLSSAWRLSKVGRKGVKAAFLTYGLPLPISCTPRMHGPRGNEVLAWLQHNTLNAFSDAQIDYKHRLLEYPGEFGERQYSLPVPIKVAQFVAIDDRDFRTRTHGGHYRRLLSAMGHFVHVDCTHGLSEANIQEAALLLTSPLVEPGSIERVDRRSLPPSPIKGYCQYCEKRVRNGTGIHDHGALFCSLDCLYRYNGTDKLFI